MINLYYSERLSAEWVFLTILKHFLSNECRICILQSILMLLSLQLNMWFLCLLLYLTSLSQSTQWRSNWHHIHSEYSSCCLWTDPSFTHFFQSWSADRWNAVSRRKRRRMRRRRKRVSPRSVLPLNFRAGRRDQLLNHSDVTQWMNTSRRRHGCGHNCSGGPERDTLSFRGQRRRRWAQLGLTALLQNKSPEEYSHLYSRKQCGNTQVTVLLLKCYWGVIM